MPDVPIQITRYPNRRFYARNESRYVSLQEIEEMVRAGNSVEIHDSQTDEDLTAGILARIIIERQPDKMRLFPTDMLHFMVRSNDVMSDFLRDYFRHSLPYLEYLQRHGTATVKSLVQPMHWVQAWLDSIAPQSPSQKAPVNEPPKAEPPKAEMPVPLSTRIAELEARIRQLEGDSTGHRATGSP
jgi:polyhydroxyalkanoate synthesis repressor PhaR